MAAPLQYQNEHFRTPSPDTDLVLMLHNHMQPCTSTVGTQTDPEIFYVNGKPARAVQPFRVVPKPKPEQNAVVETDEDEEDGETHTEDQEEQPHTSGWQQAQWSSAEQEPVMQVIEIQGEVELEAELEVEEEEREEDEEIEEEEEVREEEEPEPPSPEPEMLVPAHQMLQSQETQTELQHLQRQLHLLKEDEQAVAEAQ